MTSDHRLVGRDDGFAVADGLQDQAARRFDPADYLHDHIHTGIIHDGLRICREQIRWQVNRPWSLEVADGHANQIEV